MEYLYSFKISLQIKYFVVLPNKNICKKYFLRKNIFLYSSAKAFAGKQARKKYGQKSKGSTLHNHGISIFVVFMNSISSGIGIIR